MGTIFLVIETYACMYVCVYVYVFMYVCMHVSPRRPNQYDNSIITNEHTHTHTHNHKTARFPRERTTCSHSNCPLAQQSLSCNTQQLFGLIEEEEEEDKEEEVGVGGGGGGGR